MDTDMDMYSDMAPGIHTDRDINKGMDTDMNTDMDTSKNTDTGTMDYQLYWYERRRSRVQGKINIDQKFYSTIQ
jgi:hypothetical protein